MPGFITSGKQTDKKTYIFFIPENKHHINFIVMFLYYFQLFIIHVNGCISFGPVTFSPVLARMACKFQILMSLTNII